MGSGRDCVTGFAWAVLLTAGSPSNVGVVDPDDNDDLKGEAVLEDEWE